MIESDPQLWLLEVSGGLSLQAMLFWAPWLSIDSGQPFWFRAASTLATAGSWTIY